MRFKSFINEATNLIFRAKNYSTGKTAAEFYKASGQVGLDKDTKYFKSEKGKVTAEYKTKEALEKAIKAIDPLFNLNEDDAMSNMDTVLSTAEVTADRAKEFQCPKCKKIYKAKITKCKECGWEK